MSKVNKLDAMMIVIGKPSEGLFSGSDQAADLPLDPQPSANLPKVTGDVSGQLAQLIGPLQQIISSGVVKKGFHPIAIAHAMMIAGMLELVEAAGEEFTLEILTDMIVAVEGVEKEKAALQ